MPKFLESKLKKEYGAKSKVPYKVMNSIGAMKGNKETAKGRDMERMHKIFPKIQEGDDPFDMIHMFEKFKGVTQNAAKYGELECLKYAHENGCPWDEETCASAAEKGKLECLKYAHENGCPWDEDTCEFAAAKGDLECLKYACENGCPCDIRMCKVVAANSDVYAFCQEW